MADEKDRFGETMKLVERAKESGPREHSLGGVVKHLLYAYFPRDRGKFHGDAG